MFFDENADDERWLLEDDERRQVTEENTHQNQIAQFACRRLHDRRRMKANEYVHNKEANHDTNTSNEANDDRQGMTKIDRGDR